MNRRRWLPGVLGLILVGLALLGDSAPVFGQLPGMPPTRRKYTPVDAAFDSYYAGDAQRLAEIDRQLGLNNRMRLTGWYGSYLPGVFEPWPMIPGGIWGYPILNPIRQSVGQRSYQAGPDRWISEPVYADQLAPPAVEAVGLPVPLAGNVAPGRPVERPAPRPEPDDAPGGAAAPTGPGAPALGPREF